MALSRFINEPADYARRIRPAIKTTIHVWPTYLPEPLYGNRLDVDYCCQTVAWFFPPYWPLEKIAEDTRRVVGEQNRVFPRAKGIPFLGIYLGKSSIADKPLEQFRDELKAIFREDPSRSLSIHEFGDVVLNPEYFKVLQIALHAAPENKEGHSKIP